MSKNIIYIKTYIFVSTTLSQHDHVRSECQPLVCPTRSCVGHTRGRHDSPSFVVAHRVGVLARSRRGLCEDDLGREDTGLTLIGRGPPDRENRPDLKDDSSALRDLPRKLFLKHDLLSRLGAEIIKHRLTVGCRAGKTVYIYLETSKYGN